MRRTAPDRTRNRPAPAERVELTEGSTRARWIAAAALLAVGLGLIVYGLTSLLHVPQGWQRIGVDAAASAHCGGDFVLWYDLGGAGVSTPAQKRALTHLYTQAAQRGYRVFHAGQAFEGCGNVQALNAHVNEEIEIDPLLWRALALCERQQARWHCLGPVWQEYYALSFSVDDQEARAYDPARNGEQAAYVRQVAAFAAAPAHVRVELLPEWRARLAVSDAYLAFARDNGIRAFVDFGWMKNAFLADFLADTLAEAGWQRGAAVSRDGFTRCLAGCGSWTADVPALLDGRVVTAAQLTLDAPAALVSLRAFPAQPGQEPYYYRHQDGGVFAPHTVGMDGRAGAALPQLTGVSRAAGCAELLLRVLPVFQSPPWNGAAAAALADGGIGLVSAADGAIRCTVRGAKLGQVLDGLTVLSE